MSPNTAQKLAAARSELADAREALLRARAAVLAGDANLRRLSRERAAGDHDLAVAANQQLTLRQALGTAALREQQAQSVVDAALAELLAANSTTEVDTLSTAFPIVLLPVRLETRFAKDGNGGAVLKIRVYPDEIMADTHEPPLTVVERAAGERFWGEGWLIDREPGAWRALTSEFPAPRAAWIARQLTPSNLADRPAGAPVFPDTPMRPESWTRGAETRVLPDRWMAVAFRNGVEVARQFGSPIQDPLILSVAPITDDEVDGSTVEISSDGLRLDTAIAWTVDFDRALAVGMGLTLPLDATLADGFDRLIVVGVKASLAPDAAAERIRELLDAHHYDTGLAFLRQGTPTNNTIEAPSPFPPADVDGAVSFAIERGAPLALPSGNGVAFARALGVPESLVEHVGASDLLEQPHARAMNEALWPVTWKYFLDQLMEPVVPDAAVRAAHDHFVRHVRGRGPLPAFRVGATPYGLLPVSSLTRWTTAESTGVEPHLPPLLRDLRRIWRGQVAQVPRIGASADADADLLGVLGMDASARAVHARPMLGPQLQHSLLSALNIAETHWQSALRAIARDVLTSVGGATWNPRLAAMTFADEAHRVSGPFVAASLSETEPLQPFNYITWIRTASLDDLREEDVPAGASRPRALLYFLLRHAALSLYADVATKVAVKHGAAIADDLRELETPGVGAGGATRPTIWDRLSKPIPNVTGGAPLGRFVLGDAGPDTREIRAFRTALRDLEGLPTAELDRLVTETLDTCSHRLDAWITSLASKRLDELRQQQPAGSHLGAFGWVEDLHPDGDQADVEPADLGGFIHAPSMSHAATAAVLRNAYVAHAAQGADRYALDLSSTRVRSALQLLDAVRQGQPLGAVLGYRFERGLHEGHRPLRLEKYIDPLRRLFPLVADKGGESGEPTESIAARNVVDGLLLRTAAQAGTIPWGQQGLPASGNDRSAIEAELQSLDRAVDAVADLLTAESVFQIVRGNTERAASVLDAVGQGLRPPEPDIVLQPRTGTAAAHRVAVVLGGAAATADPWSTVSATPRALAEPWLDRWVGSLLGDPAAVRCRVRHHDASGQSHTREVTLAELGVRPLDVLELTRTLDADAGSELDAHVGATAPAASTSVEILYAADPAWDRDVIRTFPDALELARAITAQLATSRALQPEDLLPAEDVQTAEIADRLAAEATQRAAAAEAALNAVRAQLAAALDAPAVVAEDVRTALRRASLFGVRGAFDGSRQSGDTLLAAGVAAASELARRSAAAGAAATPVEKVRAVFGRDFMFLPRFRPINATELNLAVGHDGGLAGDRGPVIKWMQQLARVRPNLASWRQLTLIAGVLGHPGSPFSIAQLPHASGGRWIGLPFGSEADRPAAGRLSLALHQPSPLGPSDPWVGLVLDEWVELIPRPTEDTGLAFHYDDPGAEAAQTVLVAVPPTQSPTWDLGTLLDTLNETLDLAKIRAVDSELLPLGQLLPAIYLAANPLRETVATDLRAVLQRANALG